MFDSLCFETESHIYFLWLTSLPLIPLQVIVVEESSQVACPITTKLVLDEDEETKEPLLQVHRNLVTKLKPHQVDGKDEVISAPRDIWAEQQYYPRQACVFKSEMLWTNPGLYILVFLF